MHHKYRGEIANTCELKTSSKPSKKHFESCKSLTCKTEKCVLWIIAMRKAECRKDQCLAVWTCCISEKDSEPIWALPDWGGGTLASMIWSTVFRNEVSERARLSEGWEVQWLFDQCPNRFFFEGASWDQQFCQERKFGCSTRLIKVGWCWQCASASMVWRAPATKSLPVVCISGLMQFFGKPTVRSFLNIWGTTLSSWWALQFLNRTQSWLEDPLNFVKIKKSCWILSN